MFALSRSGTVGLMPRDMFGEDGGLVERVGVGCMEDFSLCVVKIESISRRRFGDCEVCDESVGSVVESVETGDPDVVYVGNGRPETILSILS
jgi:hypothetical protein